MNNKVDYYAGQIIKEKRKEKRLTQTQLGEKVGLPYSTLACYESGLRGMSLETFFILCKALKIDVNDAQKEIQKRLDDNA